MGTESSGQNGAGVRPHVEMKNGRPGLNGVAGPCASAGELVKLAPHATTNAKTKMRAICFLLRREGPIRTRRSSEHHAKRGVPHARPSQKKDANSTSNKLPPRLVKHLWPQPRDLALRDAAQLHANFFGEIRTKPFAPMLSAPRQKAGSPLKGRSTGQRDNACAPAT